MKVNSTVPFEFPGIRLEKGESDFDIDKLDSSHRQHFVDLVKADVVKILDGTTHEQVLAGEKGSIGSPDAKRDLESKDDELTKLRAENDRLREQLSTASTGFKGSPEPNSLPALDATASPYNQTPPAAANEIAAKGVEKANEAKPDATSTTTTKSNAPADPLLPTPSTAPLGANSSATVPAIGDDATKKISRK